ncbi:MAG: hypothetical protein K2X93_20685 [Candidatus Obscuribacterales bacterium]|nr:hypothetical protein [Candidatus Obscuribacterales bacterium]
MLDVRKPLGLLFMILGGILFIYGLFFSPGVEFHTPGTGFLLKLNQPVGAFMFVFGLIMWQLARYVELNTLERELKNREKELADDDKIRALELPTEEESAGSHPRVSGGAAQAADEQSEVDLKSFGVRSDDGSAQVVTQSSHSDGKSPNLDAESTKSGESPKLEDEKSVSGSDSSSDEAVGDNNDVGSGKRV